MNKIIYYRGWINFCNYSCSYCPFSKNRWNEEIIEKEKKELNKFYNYLKGLSEEVNIMICPYGEALYHEFYQDFMIDVARLNQVKGIGIQTNLSLSIKSFLKKLKILKEEKKKIYIWATWHSEYQSVKTFTEKIIELSKEVQISVGIVANRKNKEEIFELRKSLPSSIYLWLNAMEQKKNQFIDTEIAELSKIDPLFPNEFSRYRKNFPKICLSYENIYIDRGIYSSRCFFKKQKNFGVDCHDNKKCDCYLGYSNFSDNSIRDFFGENFCFRVPKNYNFKNCNTKLYKL